MLLGFRRMYKTDGANEGRRPQKVEAEEGRGLTGNVACSCVYVAWKGVGTESASEFSFHT